VIAIGGAAVKLNVIQVVQLLSMLVMPIVISANVPKAEATVWSCLVIAVLMVGVSISSVATAFAKR